MKTRLTMCVAALTAVAVLWFAPSGAAQNS